MSHLHVEIKMPSALVIAELDNRGNAIIPHVAPIPVAIDPRSDFQSIRNGTDLTTGWADLTQDRFDYVDQQPGNGYNILTRKHRFLKKLNDRTGNELYEVYIDRRATRQPILADAPRRELTTFVTGRQDHSRVLRGGSRLVNVAVERYLQKYFPIMTVRKDALPDGITNVHKFSIIPSSSRIVREGFALATFHSPDDGFITRSKERENDNLREVHRKASQAIWTSLILPFLMLVKPAARMHLNDVHIKITMIFVVESVSEQTPQALFYLNIPVRYYHISDTNNWLRDLQYSVLNRLIYTDISRTDSNRRVRSIEQITVTFVRTNLNAGPNDLGGFIPPLPVSDTASCSSVRTSSTSRSKDVKAHDLFKKNAFKWSDPNGWFLTSFKTESKLPHEQSSAKKMCIYWACLKGIRLMEHSFYSIPEEWRTVNERTSAHLQNEAHKNLRNYMKIKDIDDMDGVSYGSPIVQALSNVLEVDIRIMDSDWNILSHYRPMFRRTRDRTEMKRSYPKPDQQKTCTASRQIFSVEPVCYEPTITLVLLEHVKDALVPGMGMTFDQATEQWENRFSCADVVENESNRIRVPGTNVIPTFQRDTSLWHYWLVVSVGAKEEKKMCRQASMKLDYIPLCSHCEKNKCKQSLLACTAHGPSPVNSGDRRRRIFKNLQDIATCENCGMYYPSECDHVCRRNCTTCFLSVPINELENGTHVCISNGFMDEVDETSETNSIATSKSRSDGINDADDEKRIESFHSNRINEIVSKTPRAKMIDKRKKNNGALRPKLVVDEKRSRCENCGLIVSKDSLINGRHKCNPNAVQYFLRLKSKNTTPRVWFLGRDNNLKNTFDGYIVWDLETFPSADDGFRMLVYRCGLYHNTFAREQMGMDGTYIDIVCTVPTRSGQGDVILRMLQYLASPKFNNYVAISYFGCVFDHYLLLQNILNDRECNDLFKVSQPDFSTFKKFKKDVDEEYFRETDLFDVNCENEDQARRTKHYREFKSKKLDERMRQNWVVKNKRIFSMWLSEPTEQQGAEIAPRYSIKFIDLGLFTQCSLKQACKDFGLSKDESKQIFPHDFISSWSDLLYRGPVPDKKFFPISSQDEAVTMKYDYERKGKEWDLLSVSEEYLRMDVMSTRQVFLKFSDTIETKLGIPLTSSITLPSLAQKVLKKSLKEKNGTVIDLASTPIESQDFRSTIFGGRVMPLRDRFLSPCIEEMESSLVLLRRAYAKCISEIIVNCCSYMNNSNVPDDIKFLLKTACSEVFSASKVCPPENVFVLLVHEHLSNPELADLVPYIIDHNTRNTPNYMDWNDWVSIWFDRCKDEGCLRAVDVSSLYPSSMAFHPYPTGGHSEVCGSELDLMTECGREFVRRIDLENFGYGILESRIADLKSCDHWPVAGIFYIKYVPNQRLAIPVLPRKVKNMLLWDLISAEGWYNSVDIENAVCMGYDVEFVRGYQWFETAPVFKDVILDLYDIKAKAESEGDATLRSIAKLLMNSMYGKMLQKPINEFSGLVYNDYDLSLFMKHYLWTGFESIGIDNLCMLVHGIHRPKEPEDGSRIVQWDEESNVETSNGTKSNSTWLGEQPVQLGSFILGYSRRIMLQYFCAANPSMDVSSTAYYTDTDSIFLSNEQFCSLERQGFVKDGLGFLADDFKGAIGIEAYFNNPKSYLVTKIKKSKGKEPAQLYSQIKAKGIAKSCLSNTYKIGYMDEGEHWLNLPNIPETEFLFDDFEIQKKRKKDEVERHSFNKTSFKRGDMWEYEGVDPEVFILLNELREMDEDIREINAHDPNPNPTYGQEECQYSWDVDVNEVDIGFDEEEVEDRMMLCLSPEQKREMRLEQSRSIGKLDKFSFVNARRQCDGRSKRPLSEHVTFPTFKRFLGRTNKEVERGETNFSIVPKTITRSFGSRLYLGSKYVPGSNCGFYRPWNNADLDNAALCRAGPKGEKWAKELDDAMDEDFLQLQME